MSTLEINQAVDQLRELRRMADELEAEIEAVRDRIKAHMSAAQLEELTGKDWRITYKAVTSSRFDAKAFRKEHAVMAEKYTKQTTTRRLTVQ